MSPGLRVMSPGTDGVSRMVEGRLLDQAWAKRPLAA